MNLKAAFLATATAGAFLLVPACGGDGAGSESTQSQVASRSPSGTGSVGGSGSSIRAQYVAIELQPSSTGGYGTGDGELVGTFGGGNGGSPHAVLWRGSASSAVDLHPNGF